MNNVPINNNTINSNHTTTSLQDKIILLGFLALMTVDMVYGHHPTRSPQQNYIFPHHLSNNDDDLNHRERLKKLHRYYRRHHHPRWGGSGGNDNNNDSAVPSIVQPQHSATTTSGMVSGTTSALQDQLLIMLHQEIRGGAVEATAEEFEDDDDDDDNYDEETNTSSIVDLNQQLDYSDNKEQVRILQHHYLNEFGRHISLSQVLKDYSDDCTIHQVIDNQSQTFHGHEGARQAFVRLFNLVPHDLSLSHHIEFEHVAIDHNHAQVVWKAKIPSQQRVIRGMDSFAFDENNRIIHQTIMALSVPFLSREDTE